jgi:hypothetical protein
MYDKPTRSKSGSAFLYERHRPLQKRFIVAHRIVPWCMRARGEARPAVRAFAKNGYLTTDLRRPIPDGGSAGNVLGRSAQRILDFFLHGTAIGRTLVRILCKSWLQAQKQPGQNGGNTSAEKIHNERQTACHGRSLLHSTPYM